MKCPNCSTKMRKLNTRYECPKCANRYTKREIELINEQDWLAEHKETVELMEDNGGVGNY